MRRRAAVRDGFTLIEVLVALSVLGVTLTAVFTLFASGLNLRSVTRERLAFNRDVRLLVSDLTDDLANLVPAGPQPMVSAEAIVLWRTRDPVKGVRESGAVPELVTYQWSGSDEQDSLLVRVAAPMAVDVSDFEAVEAEFLKWARTFERGSLAAKDLVREDDGRRFGDIATLNDLSGRWTGYPGIHGFACGQDSGEEGDLDDDPQSRLMLRLAAGRFTATVPGLTNLADLDLLSPEEAGLDIGLWLPVSARTLVAGPPPPEPVEETRESEEGAEAPAGDDGPVDEEEAP